MYAGAPSMVPRPHITLHTQATVCRSEQVQCKLIKMGAQARERERERACIACLISMAPLLASRLLFFPPLFCHLRRAPVPALALHVVVVRWRFSLVFCVGPACFLWICMSSCTALFAALTDFCFNLHACVPRPATP